MNSSASSPRLAISSWSLNRTLGAPHFDAARNYVGREPQGNALPLLEMPQALADFGINRMELCHFHLPQSDSKYLQQLREATESANVELWALLIDDGDITHPEEGEKWMQWTRDWIDIASELGARNVRIIAGKQAPTPGTLQLSRDRLQVLADYAQSKNVGVLTENWFALLDEPRAVLWLLDELKGEVGLKFDFGNWKGERKYDDLPQIAPRAVSCHAKCSFDGTTPDSEDYRRCLQMLKDAGYRGPYTLIYDSENADEWAQLAIEREIVSEFL